MMRAELLQRVMAEKRALREEHERLEAQRLLEAGEACPEIAALVQERREAIMEGLRLAMQGIVPLRIEEDTLRRNRRIEALLTAQGLPGDYLSPIFDCPLCEDSGYAGESQNQLWACMEQRCLELALGGQFPDDSQTFESYDETVFPLSPVAPGQASQRAYMRVIRKACEDYADSLPEGKLLNLLLYGGSGLGKTFLLRSIAHRAGQNGVACLATTANTLLNAIRKQYFSREEAPEADYMGVPLLLIDDLGTEPLWENITVEQLFALIDHRLSHGLHTVISTNLSLTELKARYTERIMSRLLDQRLCRTLAFMGKDVRLNPS